MSTNNESFRTQEDILAMVLHLTESDMDGGVGLLEGVQRTLLGDGEGCQGKFP